jgi:hypothetical protein
MSHDFKTNDEVDLAVYSLDEYDPVEEYENLNAKAIEADSVEDDNSLDTVSNDDFITAIFGCSFTAAHPLVCKKSGDPDKSGWSPLRWPCNTSEPDQNYYILPALYRPDDSGRYYARKAHAEAVYAVMVDDVGTKISIERFNGCPPSWAIETSPGNYQYGYIFSEPITDLDIADKLKENLIEAELCDSGATGGTARWMRLPVAINGRPKYGSPSPKCRLVEWRPNLKFTIPELESKLNLLKVNYSNKKNDIEENIFSGFNLKIEGKAEQIIEELKSRDMYKKPLGAGKHDITCPWYMHHTDSLDTGAAYFEPSEKYPTGGFKCQHSHGHLFHINDLKEFLGIDKTHVKQLEVISAPQKLPNSLKPVPKLDINILPNTICGAIRDLADRLQCPPDYLAVSMLCAAGAVIGNKIGIFPYANDESWEVYPALWGGIVGDPGSKKTPSLQAALKPLHHLEEIASQKYALEMQKYELANRQYQQDLVTWNKNKNQTIKPTIPTEPKRERFVVHDTTYQALGVILSENPRGILALADELSGLIQSLDTSGQEAARGFYLSGWSGTGSYSFDRIGRGAITLPRYTLSVFGGFQPDRIKAYVQFSQRGSSKNDGLLQRFQLLVWPDQVGTFNLVDRKPDKALIEGYFKSIVQLSNLSNQKILNAINLPNGSQVLHFDLKAQKLFHVWFLENEKMLAKGNLDSARQSHYAKYRSLVPALALLFHLLDKHKDAVCEDCLTRAILFAQYLKKHADRIYASVSGFDLASVRILAGRLLEGKLQDGFTCRSLRLLGWSGLSTNEQAQAAIDALVEYRWLIETEVRNGGRPTIKYRLNPNVTQELL